MDRSNLIVSLRNDFPASDVPRRRNSSAKRCIVAQNLPSSSPSGVSEQPKWFARWRVCRGIDVP